MALERDLEFELGQDITIDFSLDNGSGSAETVTGWTFAFTVKKTKDGSALFTKTSSDGISVLAASTKPQIRVTIARANTSSLSLAGTTTTSPGPTADRIPSTPRVNSI
jgi:hypothetical protein